MEFSRDNCNIERRNLAHKLESEFNTSFKSFQNNLTESAKMKLEKACLKYDLFLTESAEKSLNRSRHAFYTKSNKAGTYLARALKSINKTSKPIRPKLSRDIYTSNHIKIVHTFHSHLASLYTETNTCNPVEADSPQRTYFSKRCNKCY